MNHNEKIDMREIDEIKDHQQRWLNCERICKIFWLYWLFIGWSTSFNSLMRVVKNGFSSWKLGSKFKTLIFAQLPRYLTDFKTENQF